MAYSQKQISEADWKVWRALSAEALERFCQNILTEAARLETGETSARSRFSELFQLVMRRDKEVGEVFDNPRRSTAYLQIALAVQRKAITHGELERFSKELQDDVHLLLEGLRQCG